MWKQLNESLKRSGPKLEKKNWLDRNFNFSFRSGQARAEIFIFTSGRVGPLQIYYTYMNEIKEVS